MCGIAGIVHLTSSRPIEQATLERMRDVLHHRGPDDAGLIVDGPVGLAHRRLSIVDLATGHQPMCNEDGTVWISYNGEIYNHAALRPRLEAVGHVFRTTSDTETIVHLYEAEGERCVEHLRGMFAFAIWDRSARRLLLARDRLGIKPLYYATAGEVLIFGSEIKAVLAHGAVRPEFESERLPEFLANRYVAGRATMFRGIRALRPGHILTWAPGAGLTERRYWRLPAPAPAPEDNDDGYRRQFLRRLEEAVEGHLMADVPLGVFLSGGIDSSVIAGLMARLVGRPIRAFSVGFAEAEANELPWARQVAAHVGAEQHEIVVSPGDYFAALPSLVWSEDKPIAFTSSVPLHFVSRLARQHVKVVLTGEGSDELLLGYNRYRVTAWNDRLGRPYGRLVPRALRAAVASGVASLPRGAGRYLSRTFLALPPDLAGLYFDNFAVFTRAQQRAILAPGWRGLIEAHDPYATAAACFAAGSGGLLDRLSATDIETYLVELLMKQDRMSMAASVESRVPFLDHPLVEFVARMPVRFKVRGLTTKYILRAAARGLVPPAILARRKMGFPVPIGQWLRARFWPVVEDLVLGPRALARGYLDPGAVRALALAHRAGAADHAERLWLLLNLELWCRIFLDGEPVEQAAGRWMS